MNSIAFQRWINNKLRAMGLNAVFRSKSMGLMFIISLVGFFFIYFKLSKVVELQNIQIDIVKKQSQNIEAMKDTHPSSSVTLVYWLSAKSADSPHMKHVRNVFAMMGFERWDGKTSSWNVTWAYEYPFPSKIAPTSLKPHQKVNHFPGSGYLTSKVFLAKSKSRHIPVAFELPRDNDKFLDFAKKHRDKLWVQKSNQHRGVTIKAVNELDLTASNSFVQEFVSDPLLIDGRKFDIGIYTIITSVNPLRVYVYDGDWLIRFCPEDYQPLDVSNRRKYVVEDDYTPTWEMPSLRDYYTRLKLSHKRSVLAYIRQQNMDPDDFQKRIYSAVADVILDKQPDMIRSLTKYPDGSRNFFEMVRFDFVCDSKLKIFLMEVNMSPNLSSAHFSANSALYEQVLFNTLSVAGVANMRYMKGERDHADDVLVSDQDIQVYYVECPSCSTCEQSEICKLCIPCLSEDLKRTLKSAYLEHVNKMQSVRVFPKAAPNNGVESLMTTNDKLMSIWFRGMCLKSETWCN